MVTLQFTPFFNTPPIYFNTPPRCRLSTIRLHSTASKTATPIIASYFMADFLVDSLGFSRAEAISASMEVRHLKSTKKPELVLKCFEKYGLDKQIRKIVSCSPKVLTHKVDQTLEPKIKVLLEDNGFSGPDLVKLIKKNPFYFLRGLDTCILPMIRYLKLLMCDDEKVVEAITESPWLLSSPSALRKMQRNVEMLRNHGLSIENIRKFIIENTRGLLLKPKSIEDALSRVDNELEIPLDSARFYDGVHAFASVSKEKLERKFAIFRSFGWTDVDIMNMGKKQPYSLLMSEDKIPDALIFS